jgi:uncharacterized protein (DUF1697 family)
MPDEQPDEQPDERPGERMVALLRGINLGRAKRIRMADLRSALEEAGYEDVRTLLQSGNVVLTPATGTAGGLAEDLEHLVLERFGFDIRVVVRTAGELARVVARSPVPDPADGSRFLVAFLSEEPPRGAFRPPDLPPGSAEQWWPRGREVYVWCPDGLQNSPIMMHFGTLRLDAAVTVRNWNTVTALADLANRDG